MGTQLLISSPNDKRVLIACGRYPRPHFIRQTPNLFAMSNLFCAFYNRTFGYILLVPFQTGVYHV